MASELQKEALRRIQFGVFEADLSTCELYRSGLRVRLQNQPFRLLAILLENAGEVVTRETIQTHLWDSDTNVDFEHSLHIAVKKLRDALGDSAENPRYIETLSKRGYRFLAPVRNVVLQPAPTEVSSANAELKLNKVWELRAWQLATVVSGLLILALAVFFTYRPTSHKPFHIDQITHTGTVLASEADIENYSALAWDGMRLYFSSVEAGTTSLAVALAGNGETGNFRLPKEISAPLIGALSPDGSKLIVRSHLQAASEQPLWVVQTLEGNAHVVPKVLAHDAVWMPDGKRLLVAYSDELIVVGENGSDAHHFLTIPGRAFWMRWSPDGRRLRFTVRDPRRQTLALWEVQADGGNMHPLLPDWSKPAAECCGSWTSDGKEYVFESRHDGESQIWSINDRPWLLSHALPRQITSGPLDFEGPVTDPSGHHICFIGVGRQVELLQKRPDTNSYTSLNQNLNSAALVEYSIDGRWVAWLNASDGSLWRSRIDGSERIQLTATTLRIFSMKWSPDARRLALMGKEPGMPWKIYSLDADGGNPSPLLAEDVNEADPSWSADGKMLAFGRLPERMDSEKQSRAIYLRNMENGIVSEVPQSTDYFSPRLSPDGRFIIALRLDQHALMLFDRRSERWTTLITHGAGDPFWSRDGRLVYFQDFLETGKPIYRVSISTAKVEKVSDLADLQPISATDFRLIGLATGDLPIVAARTSTVNIYRVDLGER